MAKTAASGMEAPLAKANVTALNEGEVPLFVGLFSRFAEIREYLVTRILFEPGGEGLAIACRAGSGFAQ